LDGAEALLLSLPVGEVGGPDELIKVFGEAEGLPLLPANVDGGSGGDGGDVDEEFKESEVLSLLPMDADGVGELWKTMKAMLFRISKLKSDSRCCSLHNKVEAADGLEKGCSTSYRNASCHG
jgi:hypothetical protein